MRAIIGKRGAVIGAVAMVTVLTAACGSGVRQVTDKSATNTVNPNYTGKVTPAQVTSGNAPVLTTSLTGATEAHSLQQLISSIFSTISFNNKPTLGLRAGLSTTNQVTGTCTSTAPGSATTSSSLDAQNLSISNSITFDKYCTPDKNGQETVIESGTSTQELKTETAIGDGSQTADTINVGFQSVKALGIQLDGTISLKTTSAGAMGGTAEVAILYRLVHTNLTDSKQSALNLDVITAQNSNIKINGKLCQQDEGCVDVATDDQGNITLTGADESKVVLNPAQGGGYQASVNGSNIEGNVNLDLTVLGAIN